MKTKSQAIAEKIAALNAELESVKQAESEAADRELLRLVHKAGIRARMIEYAHEQIDQQRRKKASDRPANEVPDE